MALTLIGKYIWQPSNQLIFLYDLYRPVPRPIHLHYIYIFKHGMYTSYLNVEVFIPLGTG